MKKEAKSTVAESELGIIDVVSRQKDFFSSGKSLEPSWRIEQLKKLYKALNDFEKQFFEALAADLGKSEFEAYSSELFLIKREIQYQIRHVKRWSRPSFRLGEISAFFAKEKIFHEPYGVTLIMSPWNYPFLLTLLPLVNALAAGNTAVLKTSEYSPASSKAIKELVSQTFEPEYVTVLEGGYMENQLLLQQKFDFIFFTGSPAVGKIVMENAARNLTPVCLELGGKSPCIVDTSANLPLAARKIVWGKLLNAGQTCVAPDYLLVQEDKKEELLKLIKEEIAAQYGDSPLTNPELPKIINKKHFNRLLSLAPQAQIDPAANKIAPTIVDLGSCGEENTTNHPLMKEEIFGPVLPVITFKELGEALSFVKARPIPLALYLFSKDKTAQKNVIHTVRFGGGCINDVILHIATNRLPFGGMGNSGLGNYHGKFGFETFSHTKGLLIQTSWIDTGLRYAPYKKKLNLMKLL